MSVDLRWTHVFALGVGDSSIRVCRSADTPARPPGTLQQLRPRVARRRGL